MKNDNKYQAIVDAAERVFFQNGYENASMDQVAREANVAKGTLYLYFKSKHELYFAIGVRALGTLVEDFRNASHELPNGLSRVVALGKAFAAFRKEHPDYYTFIVDYQGERYDQVHSDGEIHRTYRESRQLFQILLDSVREGQKDGSIRSDMDPALLANLLWCQTCGVVQLSELREAFFQEFSPYSSDQVLEAYFDFTRNVLSGESHAKKS
ncbi:MAG TPA: TetR/AcrR family transcriptional regulator [Thermotogota bacterium]|nr:TetR/AcrR family transcriptional regulator [Thermotogota bacterium]HRW91570.1 TetR/AcrR family transcriptional regulator [Thermotogota bacterium]